MTAAHPAGRGRGPRAAIAAALAVAALAGPARAEPIAAIVRDRVAPALPAHLGVSAVHLPPALQSLDVDPARVGVALPRALRAGRPSVKVTVRGRAARYVPVTIAALADVAVAQRPLAPGDVITAEAVAIERRAAAAAPAPVNSVVGAVATRDVAAGAAIGLADVALPPPLPRGTSVRVEIQRGSVLVRGAGTLELAARPGEPAIARLPQTRALVRGTLVAPATVVVGADP